jgi:hypothetical protein
VANLKGCQTYHPPRLEFLNAMEEPRNFFTFSKSLPSSRGIIIINFGKRGESVEELKGRCWQTFNTRTPNKNWTGEAFNVDGTDRRQGVGKGQHKFPFTVLIIKSFDDFKVLSSSPFYFFVPSPKIQYVTIKIHNSFL